MENKTTAKASKYFKSQILNSKQFSMADKYLLSALLKDEREYSIEEVKVMLEKEKKRGVK